MPLSTVFFGDITGQLALNFSDLNPIDALHKLHEFENEMIDNCVKLSILGTVSRLWVYTNHTGHNCWSKFGTQTEAESLPSFPQVRFCQILCTD